MEPVSLSVSLVPIAIGLGERLFEKSATEQRLVHQVESELQYAKQLLGLHSSALMRRPVDKLWVRTNIQNMDDTLAEYKARFPVDNDTFKLSNVKYAVWNYRKASELKEALDRCHESLRSSIQWMQSLNLPSEQANPERASSLPPGPMTGHGRWYGKAGNVSGVLETGELTGSMIMELPEE